MFDISPVSPKVVLISEETMAAGASTIQEYNVSLGAGATGAAGSEGGREGG